MRTWFKRTAFDLELLCIGERIINNVQKNKTFPSLSAYSSKNKVAAQFDIQVFIMRFLQYLISKTFCHYNIYDYDESIFLFDAFFQRINSAKKELNGKKIPNSKFQFILDYLGSTQKVANFMDGCIRIEQTPIGVSSTVLNKDKRRIRKYLISKEHFYLWYKSMNNVKPEVEKILGFTLEEYNKFFIDLACAQNDFLSYLGILQEYDAVDSLPESESLYCNVLYGVPYEKESEVLNAFTQVNNRLGFDLDTFNNISRSSLLRIISLLERRNTESNFKLFFLANRVYAFNSFQMEESSYYFIMEYLSTINEKLVDNIYKERGIFLEKQIKEKFESMGLEVYSNVFINGLETDLLVRFGRKALVIEAKALKIDLCEIETSENKCRKYLREGIKQVLARTKAMMSSTVSITKNKEDIISFALPIDDCEPLIITFDDINDLANLNISESKRRGFVENPLILCLDDLFGILAECKNPDSFFDFVRERNYEKGHSIFHNENDEYLQFLIHSSTYHLLSGDIEYIRLEKYRTNLQLLYGSINEQK